MSNNPTVSIEELAGLLKPGNRLLGIDLGTKTIGLATSDATRTIATPLDTIRRTKFSRDIIPLAQLIEQEKIAAIVIGLPLNMNGSEGPRAQATRAFVRNLTGHITIPVAFWDERLSTVAAERTLLDADASRRRRAEVIDKMAAAYILQGALDRLANLDEE